ncbi:hypothetical protein Egran_03408 [Elaphomyces granulatus]|uniref:ceramidase n=1 Tax=Elaphomyces granulatus TaxID=519963 RepID=A0A232LXK0_9EURO|nr:hypothetical protein Egran_03408 [Elaphomyces granulatus]
MADHQLEHPTGDIPPVYRIDLSLPPCERYVELARVYRDQVPSLTAVFDDLVQSFFPGVPLKWIQTLARFCLRRLFTADETDEIRGISKALDVSMYLLVAFNVLLDLLMGCTSGGIRVKIGRDPGTKMLHFRTLDWGMDALRKIVVQLEFVSSPKSDKVLATSITYVGFVGVLTAVRKKLSVSLNFRPMHDTSSRLANFRFYFNHLLVLIGARRSISSLLRQCVLPESIAPRSNWLLNLLCHQKDEHVTNREPLSLEFLQETIPSLPTTAAYLIFSDGSSSITMEKDHRYAVVRSSPSFIVIANNDQAPHTDAHKIAGNGEAHSGLTVVSGELETMAALIEDSNERCACMQKRWDEKYTRAYTTWKRSQTQRRRGRPEAGINDVESRTQSGPKKKRSKKVSEDSSVSYSTAPTDNIANSTGFQFAATTQEAVQWLNMYPVTNETTHFAAVMDPSEGKVVWVRRYIDPCSPVSDDQRLQ